MHSAASQRSSVQACGEPSCTAHGREASQPDPMALIPCPAVAVFGAARATALAGSVRDLRYTTVVPEAVRELLATDVALDKLAGRGIAREEAEQLLQNRYAMVANLRGHPLRRQQPDRRLLIGTSDGGRALTLVVEATLDPTTWLLVTGWDSTAAERRMIESH